MSRAVHSAFGRHGSRHYLAQLKHVSLGDTHGEEEVVAVRNGLTGRSHCVLASLSLACLLFSASAGQATESYNGGTVYPEVGVPILTERLHIGLNEWVLADGVTGLYDDPAVAHPYDVTVPWTDVASIQSLGGSDVLVVRRDSSEVLLRAAGYQGSTSRHEWGSKLCVVYTYFNSVERTEEWAQVPCRDVSRIVLSDDRGDYRKCPHHDRYFQAEYLYCPYCGEHTLWADYTR